MSTVTPVVVSNSNTKVSALATVLQEMEENGKRILKENCQTVPRPHVERKIKIRNKETFHNIPPPPITCVVRERCPTPDQIVDATLIIQPQPVLTCKKIVECPLAPEPIVCQKIVYEDPKPINFKIVCVNVPSEQSKFTCDDEIFNLEKFPELAKYRQSLSLTYTVGVKPPKWETPCDLCPCPCDKNPDPIEDRKPEPKPNTSDCDCKFISA